MGKCPHYADLPKGKVNCVGTTNVVAMMIGAHTATQDNRGVVVLTYTDGTQDTAMLDYDIATEESFFCIVASVQSHRYPKG